MRASAISSTDVLFADSIHWEKKGVFFGYFLCTSKESDPRYSIAEAFDLTNVATTTSATLTPTLSRQRERGKIESWIPTSAQRDNPAPRSASRYSPQFL